MRGVWIICAKELKSLFSSPMFYIVTLMITGLLSLNFFTKYINIVNILKISAEMETPILLLSLWNRFNET